MSAETKKRGPISAAEEIQKIIQALMATMDAKGWPDPQPPSEDNSPKGNSLSPQQARELQALKNQLAASSTAKLTEFENFQCISALESYMRLAERPELREGYIQGNKWKPGAMPPPTKYFKPTTLAIFGPYIQELYNHGSKDKRQAKDVSI